MRFYTVIAGGDRCLSLCQNFYHPYICNPKLPLVAVERFDEICSNSCRDQFTKFISHH